MKRRDFGNWSLCGTSGQSMSNHVWRPRYLLMWIYWKLFAENRDWPWRRRNQRGDVGDRGPSIGHLRLGAPVYKWCRESDRPWIDYKLLMRGLQISNLVFPRKQFEHVSFLTTNRKQYPAMPCEDRRVLGKSLPVSRRTSVTHLRNARILINLSYEWQ